MTTENTSPSPGTPPASFAADPDREQSLTGLFLGQAERLAERPFLYAKRGHAWVPLTWGQAREQALRLAGALTAAGISKGDRVLLLSENRPEWLIADIAIMAAGAVTVPAYTTYTRADLAHVLADSGAVAAIVSTARLRDNLLSVVAETGSCRLVIAMEPPQDSPAGLDMISWDDALTHPPAAPAEARRTDTACIIYTSGTAGPPKGVMLSHGAILSNCAGAKEVFRNVGLGAERFLSFLPLSHSYEHTAGQFLPIAIGAEIYYAEGLDTLMQNMVEVRPTIMTAVPRLYEVLMGRITHAVARQGPLKRALFDAAVALGRKRLEHGLNALERIIDAALDRLVRARIRARFGGRLRFMVSGGAPLNAEVGLFFTALGINILQGYGQTEAAPIISCNPPERARMDTAGLPLANVELRIADDGEILVRGELVMQGYWNDPEATAEAIRDGWLHTGDIGVLDGDGYLRITDRKKDIIVNSGGDNLSPQRVEGALALEPEISQAMVYGDKRPHLVAVLVADKRDGGTPGQPGDDADFRDRVAKAVERVNARLSPIERVRRFIVAPEPFTIENGQLTPTMKLRRHVLKQAYGDKLEALYR